MGLYLIKCPVTNLITLIPFLESETDRRPRVRGTIYHGGSEVWD